MGELVLAESDYFHYVPGDLEIWEWLGKTDIAGSLIHAGTGHNVDLLRYFCGEVAEVSCFKDIRMPRTTQIQTEDIAILNLRFAGGALGRVGLFLGPILPFTFSLRLFGTRGSLDNERIWLDSSPRFAESGRERDLDPAAGGLGLGQRAGRDLGNLEGVAGRLHRRRAPGPPAGQRRGERLQHGGGLLRRPAVRGGRPQRAARAPLEETKPCRTKKKKQDSGPTT